jgi:hypothetical protein
VIIERQKQKRMIAIDKNSSKDRGRWMLSAVHGWQPFVIGVSSPVTCPLHQKVIIVWEKQVTTSKLIQHRCTSNFRIDHGP